jgi:hypothetical protein
MIVPFGISIRVLSVNVTATQPTQSIAAGTTTRTEGECSTVTDYERCYHATLLVTKETVNSEPLFECAQCGLTSLIGDFEEVY